MYRAESCAAAPHSAIGLAGRAELTVQERTGPVVGRVLLRSAAREVEGGQGDLVRDTVGSVIVFCRAKQRARISCEDAAQDPGRSDSLFAVPAMAQRSPRVVVLLHLDLVPNLGAVAACGRGRFSSINAPSAARARAI